MNDFKKKYRTKEETEIINYYDCNGKKIGCIDREEGIKNNLLLEAVQIWIINPKTTEVLMQKRSLDKSNDPGMIDVSASGHVKKNEVPLQAIIREGKEELGEEAFEKIISSIQKIYEIKIDFSKSGRKGFYNVHVYIAFTEQELGKYKKQDEEVEELFLMKYMELKEKIKNREANIRIPYEDSTEELFSKIEEKLFKEKELEK